MELGADVRILASAGADLVRVARGLVVSNKALVESNRVMRDLLVQHSKRLERLEGNV